MDKLSQLRLCEQFEEDALDGDEIQELYENTEKSFKEAYKEFYSDIKVSPKEDW